MAAGVDGAAAGALQLAVFDDRRSVADGDDPADQLLAYYPERVGSEDRAGAVGLMRAVMAFTSIFTEDAADEVAMDAQQHHWVSYAAEPHVYLLLIAEASWCGPLVRHESLRGVLAQLHRAVQLLHGSVQQLLQQSPLEEARAALAAVLSHFGGALTKGSMPHVLEPSNPLSAAGSVPFFPLSRRTFTGLQAACEGLLLLPLRVGSTAGGGGSVSGVVAMCGRHCLWSTASQQDTAALVSLATGALLPHASGSMSAAAAWRKLKGAALASAGRSPSLSKQQPSQLPLDTSAWAPASDSFLHLAASQTAAAVSATDTHGGNRRSALRLPDIHLQGGEVCQLLPMQQGEALLLLLMAAEWQTSAEGHAALAVAAASTMQWLASAAAAELAAAQDGHVKGLRYLHTDGVLGGARASPAAKAATLHRDSAALAATVRQQLDERLAASLDPPEDADLEVVARGAGDCWVSAHVDGLRGLTVVLEGRGEGGLQEASSTAGRFAAAHFPGMF